ncbi:hypothetical protein LCGC14_1402530 [marine sediment metagenome]|uniref:Uncharacterized protein n=1 Tax=marine sediment metagenome TaxID=412755 RepID=A0A0F9KHI9_9ZZZZ
MGKFTNPYKRLEEIKEQTHSLEVKIAGERNQKQKKEFETEVMFLVFEQLPIEDTIKYFEKKVRNLKDRSKDVD